MDKFDYSVLTLVTWTIVEGEYHYSRRRVVALLFLKKKSREHKKVLNFICEWTLIDNTHCYSRIVSDHLVERDMPSHCHNDNTENK